MKAVAINGYGTIGKRVADAVAAQDDIRQDLALKLKLLLILKVILYTLENLKMKDFSRKQELKLLEPCRTWLKLQIS